MLSNFCKIIDRVGWGRIFILDIYYPTSTPVTSIYSGSEGNLFVHTPLITKLRESTRNSRHITLPHRINFFTTESSSKG